jgi:DNA-directed RNA polymerase subunit M/transcription elongation factor TFIIS
MGKNIRHGGESREERLRGKIRELLKEIRKKDHEVQLLKKENDRLRGYNRSEKKQEKISEKLKCSNCGKGSLSEIEVTKRDSPPLFFLCCDICGHRIRKK